MPQQTTQVKVQAKDGVEAAKIGMLLTTIATHLNVESLTIIAGAAGKTGANLKLKTFAHLL